MKLDHPGTLSDSATPRVIRAPRGRTLHARSWLTEAPLRMLMNNLDPEVAERPQDLVVYGGIGTRRPELGVLSRDRRDADGAAGRRDAARPVGKARRRVPDPCGCATGSDRELQPRPQMGRLGAFQRARSQRPHDVRPDDGRFVDLYRHAGHRAGHLRDLRGGRASNISAVTLRGRLDPDRRASAAWAARSRLPPR